MIFRCGNRGKLSGLLMQVENTISRHLPGEADVQFSPGTKLPGPLDVPGGWGVGTVLVRTKVPKMQACAPTDEVYVC